MNFVCIVFELGDKMLTLPSMENLIVQCNRVSCGCRTPLRKRKQIAKKMNMSKICCGSLATLSFVRHSQHREAAVRNQDICRRR